jgi:tellurite resistance protein TehA-like permease
MAVKARHVMKFNWPLTLVVFCIGAFLASITPSGIAREHNLSESATTLAVSTVIVNVVIFSVLMLALASIFRKRSRYEIFYFSLLFGGLPLLSLIPCIWMIFGRKEPLPPGMRPKSFTRWHVIAIIIVTLFVISFMLSTFRGNVNLRLGHRETRLDAFGQRKPYVAAE